jgi:hypothetical protein
MKYLILLLFSLSILMNSGCNDKIASAPPRIEILSPQRGSTFQLGDTFRVKAVITHEDQLHDLKLRVRRLDTGGELLARSYHRHTTRFELNEFMVLADPQVRELELYLSVSDHNDLNAVYRDTFRVGP